MIGQTMPLQDLAELRGEVGVSHALVIVSGYQLCTSISDSVE
jgi:hypothetical protein